VDYAAITSSGALAAPGSCAGTITGYWCASTSTSNGSLPAATYFATAVAYNGYVYQIGGYTGSVTAVVDYAAINNGGPATLSAWAATGSLPAATYQATAVAYNGYVYQIGGSAGGVIAVVDYAAITSSGALAAPGSCAGTITGYWCASTSTSNGSLPAATYQATAVAYNGYVYQIGGYNTTAATAVVDYAAITSSGALAAPASAACTAGGGTITGDWCASNGTAGTGANLPATTADAAAVAYNGYVYQIGGYTTAATAVVDYAAITSSGALAAPASAACTAGGGSITGDWCASNGTAGTGANLPAATYQATAVAYNGYVYQIGGSAGGATAVVDYAALTSSGALAAPGTCAGTITGDWCASTSTSNGSLPAATYQATAVAYNGYVYQIGGCSTACRTAVVDYAPIYNGGNIGPWSSTTSLPVATQNATAVAYNGYVYQIGGYAGGATAVVDYAAISSPGDVAPWTASTFTTNGSLPAATYFATAVAYNGYVYQIGGCSTACPTAVVDYAAITSSGCLYRWRRFYYR
jgi:N-acetylneuraminic acid mutarotase